MKKHLIFLDFIVDKPEFQRYDSMEKESRERLKSGESLRALGNFSHNVKTIMAGTLLFTENTYTVLYITILY